MPPLSPGQTFGEIAQGPVPGATLSRHCADHQLPFHEHAGAYVCIVLSGTFREHDTHGDAVRRAGDIIVHPAGARHADDFGQAGALCLNLPIADSVAGLAAHGVAPAARRADPAIQRAADELAAEVAKGAHGDRLIAASALAELTALAHVRGLAVRETCSRTRGDCVARVLQALDDAPDEPWTLEDLARLAERHPTHLARAFRDRTGLSVGAYRRRRRLTRVALDLRLSRVSLAALALQHGYADQAHMCREFRAFAGVSPAAWRRLQR
jgi:AraC family transcriptional regulator